MITSVTLKNYKAHRDTTIELGRFTVLVGPNGSGKTSVLEAIHKLAQAPTSTEDPFAAFGGPARPERFYSRHGSGTFAVELVGRSENEATSAGILCANPEAERQDSTWSFYWRRGDRDGADAKGFRYTLHGTVGSAILYRFEARLVASASVSRQERPFLEQDGRNAADMVATLKLSEEVAFARVQTALQAVIPDLRRIRIQRARAGENGTSTMGHKLILDFENAPDISAEDVSEGTLVTLALITAICSGPHPHTVLLDDLGLSLHPTAQMELVRQLHRLLDELPDVQIVATTHSPYVLDEMKPEDVVVLAQRPDGSVASKRLSEHPDAKMRGYVTTGELWGLGNETTWVV